MDAGSWRSALGQLALGQLALGQLAVTTDVPHDGYLPGRVGEHQRAGHLLQPGSGAPTMMTQRIERGIVMSGVL